MKQLVSNLENSAEPNSVVFFNSNNEAEIRKMADLVKSDNSNVLDYENGKLLVSKNRVSNLRLVKGALPNTGQVNVLYAVPTNKKFYIYFINQFLEVTSPFSDLTIDFYATKASVVPSNYDGVFKNIVVVFDEDNGDATMQYYVKEGSLVEFGSGSSLPMVVNSFTNNNQEALIGTSVNVTLSWSLNQTPKLLKVDNVDVAPLTTTSVVKNNITTNTTFTLKVNKTSVDTGSVTATTSVRFYNRFYIGASALSTVTSGNVASLITELSATLMNSKVKSSNVNANGKYIWFGAPESYGTPTIKMNGFVVSGFVEVIIPVQNSAGVTENYKLYNSGNIQYGTSIPLEITYP